MSPPTEYFTCRVDDPSMDIGHVIDTRLSHWECFHPGRVPDIVVHYSRTPYVLSGVPLEISELSVTITEQKRK